MKQARKRAPGAGRPPGELGAKRATLSLRLPPNMRVELTEAAKKNKRRSLSEEIMLRLRLSLDRDHGEADRPRHIRALAEVIARIALGVERATGCAWISDRYTAEQLAKGIDLFIYTYSRGDVVAPPAVVAAAEDRPPAARVTYVAQLGENEASGIISLLKATPEPPKWEPRPTLQYPSSWWGPWQLEQDLKPRRHK
jgi:hypothetical protein